MEQKQKPPREVLTMAKKFLLAIFALLLCLSLAACDGETPPAEQNAPPMDIYWNLNKELPAAENGVYTLNFLLNGQSVSYTCAEEAMAQSICYQQVLGLKLDGNAITGIIYSPDLDQQLVAFDYYVKSLGGGQVKMNSNNIYNGVEALLKLGENTKVYDISLMAQTPGALTEIQKGDGITALADSEGVLTQVFVTDRASAPLDGKAYCQKCEKEVQWYGWYSDNSLPSNGGHYALQKDINLTKTTRLNNEECCLDLAGHRVEQTVDGERIYYIPESGKLSFMDSVGGAVLRSSNTYDDSAYANHWGMIVDMESVEAEFNLYGGTLDASGRSVQYGGAINCTKGNVNIYGGKILAADPYGTGSGAIRAGGNVSMYGGEIIGGTHIESGYESINIHAGAVIRVGEGGLFRMYGGSITGGESYTNGGIMAVYAPGRIELYGGTISGGKSGGNGGGIFAATGSYIALAGPVQVFENEGSNIYMEPNAYLEIDPLTFKDAKVGITMEYPGTLGRCVEESVLQWLICENPGKRFVIQDGLLVMK